MYVACNRTIVAALLLIAAVKSSSITKASKPTSIPNDVIATCEFRTINYITDTLPQQCLKSSWNNSNATTATISAGAGQNATVTDKGHAEGRTIPGSEDFSENSTQSAANDKQQDNVASSESGSSTSESDHPSLDAAEESPIDIDSGELNEASFLSFEDWKRQTLEKAGQANANIGQKKSAGKRDSESIQNNLESLGDEGEIELNFGAFRGGDREEERTSEVKEADAQVSQELEDGRGKDHYRSKDAGITCKERFSYASFDAGATILKTHPGAKNSKAVLIENKDSYMLSECATENKFLIVELSEDIWIDTIVLANYEFFSSMIRTFRVSVSDRYPVKMEKWKDLGIYEARNSREIQAFLIENPQIWARYLRIEFLKHYGNEYYCPLSLLRVHGTRMLESWKETEANGDDDYEGDEHGPRDGEQFVPDAVAEVVFEEERLTAELKEAQAAIEDLMQTATYLSDQVEPALSSSHIRDINSHLQDATVEQLTSVWKKPETEIFYPATSDSDTCLLSDPPEQQPFGRDPGSERGFTVELHSNKITSTGPSSSATVVSSSPTSAFFSSSSDVTIQSSTPQTSSAAATSNVTSLMFSTKPSASSAMASTANKTANISLASSASVLASPSPSIPSKSQNATTSHKNKTSTTSSAPSSLPTIQESFFKAVSRRLQLLESNSTLSLKYIEEQSRILREAFTKIEKKQSQKTTNFLDTLNSTVFTELRGFRQQYDEIWQSTIISLESQRVESRREILAITSRLNVLADEVVFQKRMSIVQSMLLLLCLGLVIFSRVSAGGHLDFLALQARARNFGFPLSPLESPAESPEHGRTGNRQWHEIGERRRDGSPISRLRDGEDEDSPFSSASFYSRSENALTPPSGADDTWAELAKSPIEERLEPESARIKFSILGEEPTFRDQAELEEQAVYSPAARTPKKRKAFVRRQSSPPPNDGGLDSSSNHSLDPFHSPDQTQAYQSKVHQPIQEQNRTPDPTPPPPPQATEQGHVNGGRERASFSIARKPLPALPTH